MKKQKIAKRLLTGVLSLAMVYTSVNLPPMTNYVQAATVSSATELTSAHAGATLNSGMYYVKNNLTLNADKSHYNGLAIADDATVYINIPAGVTLTVYGGNGMNATSAGDASAPVLGVQDGFFSGHNAILDFDFTYKSVPNEVAPSTIGTGGTQATGGGAAIFVPSSATLYFLGEGNLAATGGAGGNAANGSNGAASKWILSSGGMKQIDETLPPYFYNTSNSNTASQYSEHYASGSSCKKGYTCISVMGGYAGAGGQGGAGASGGGAGIGTNGAQGNIGNNGSVDTMGFGECWIVDSTQGAKNGVTSAASIGKIYNSGVTITAQGGAGGNAGANAPEIGNEKEVSLTIYESDYDFIYTIEQVIQWYDGQPGAGGGAGGQGAGIGTGGQGGAGGQGGYSGSESWPEMGGIGTAPLKAQNGANGTWGAEKTPTAMTSDSVFPQYTVTYMDIDGTTVNSTQTYYASKTASLTTPEYIGSTSTQIVTAWKVVTPAMDMGGATSKLLTEGTSINANTPISTKGIYGNVILSPQTVTHTHDWKYKVVDNNPSKILAFCDSAENSEYCPYYGETKATTKDLTLTLSAPDATYTGLAYTGASVDNKITAVTGVSAGAIQYVGIDGTAYTSSDTAPTNGGKYQASVVIGGKTATKDFEIKKSNQTGITVGTDNYAFGGTVSTPVKKAGTVKDGVTLTYYYNTIDSNQGGTEWQTLTPDTLNPGTYYIYAVYAATDNYNAFTTPVSSFMVTGQTITPAEVTCNPVVETYDGTGHGIHVTTTIPNATITYGETADTCTLTQSPKKVNASDTPYIIYYEINARGCYTYKGSQTVTIRRADDSDGIVRDATAPIIVGVTDGKGYCSLQTIQVSDENLKEVTIDGASIVLDAEGKYQLQEKEQAQVIKAVDRSGNETTVTVIIHTEHRWGNWMIDKNATATTEGKKHIECSIDHQKRYETIPKLGASDDSGLRAGAGTVHKETVVQSGAPDATLNTSKADLVAASGILTPGEIEKVSAGTANATIWLEVAPLSAPKDTAAQTKFEEKAKELVGNNQNITYLDISLWKKLSSDANASAVHEPGKDISVTIVIPVALRNTDASRNRTYYIFRVHDGGACEMVGQGSASSDGELTFTTNKFSDYAITYKDALKSGDDASESDSDSSSEETTQTNHNAVQASDTKNPQTGDDSNLGGWIFMLWASFVGIMGITVYRKKQEAKDN